MKYGKEITEEIYGYLSQGSTQKDAAAMAGISEETFYQWMKKAEFSESVKKAELKCKHRNIVLIQNAALKTWQAAAWWLERHHKDEFALRQELTGKDGGPVELAKLLQKARERVQRPA